jgi:phosphoribosylamine--glycine ligase
MVTRDGPKLVEFNVRFGDPECQVLMLQLESDLVPYLVASATGRLASLPSPAWNGQAAVCVVLAANGYPDAPQAGSVITGAEADFGPDVVVFHAGTKRLPDGALVAAGGRVLNVCATGATLEDARTRAYAAIARIDWPGGFWRTDIGRRVVNA